MDNKFIKIETEGLVTYIRKDIINKIVFDEENDIKYICISGIIDLKFNQSEIDKYNETKNYLNTELGLEVTQPEEPV